MRQYLLAARKASRKTQLKAFLVVMNWSEDASTWFENVSVWETLCCRKLMFFKLLVVIANIRYLVSLSIGCLWPKDTAKPLRWWNIQHWPSDFPKRCSSFMPHFLCTLFGSQITTFTFCVPFFCFVRASSHFCTTKHHATIKSPGHNSSSNNINDSNLSCDPRVKSHWSSATTQQQQWPISEWEWKLTDTQLSAPHVASCWLMTKCGSGFVSFQNRNSVRCGNELSNRFPTLWTGAPSPL